MSESVVEQVGFRFTANDLAPDRLAPGVEQTLGHFYRWRDEHPDLIAEHINDHTGQLVEAAADYGYSERFMRWVSPSREREFRERRLTREIGFFCVYNMGVMPDTGVIEQFRRTVERPLGTDDVKGQIANGQDNITTLLGVFGTHIPVLRDTPELSRLGDQLRHLNRILPESVIQDGGMGKATRTMAGVLTIGVYDTLGEPDEARRDHLQHILPGAYAYGAMYPIIDDTLQDSDYIGRADREKYHKAILEGVRTGVSVEPSKLPDHPLAEELRAIHGMLLSAFPFDRYRHLYDAGESMYLAQHRDSLLTSEDVAVRGLTSIYPDIFIKAAMSRVIANIMGRRRLDDSYYNGIKINFINQLRDDLQDRENDRKAGRITPFTYPKEQLDTNPLYDLFAYSAYVVHEVFDNDPRAADTLAHFSAARLAINLFNNPDQARDLVETYGATKEITRFFQTALSITPRVAKGLRRLDTKYQDVAADLFKHRVQTDIDPRTFVTDRLQYIEDVICKGSDTMVQTPIKDIMDYALAAGGKRLRPALTLMLAEGMGVPYRTMEPLMRAVESFHTASLVFDDLPAQDDAALRRGKPTAHIAFDEAGAQLAGIGLISTGFGMLSELSKYYPAYKVNEVIRYFGLVLGPERLCHGQDMDLRMDRTEDASGEAIIHMYNLKTSTLIEAALVPVLMLHGRPRAEMELVQSYAYHAGIVFQIRDDILDAISTSTALGKDAGNDADKVNIVRVYGLDEAQKMMCAHLDKAIASCARLPFNTDLLQGTVNHFASRTK
jgi:geranylgeranyl pyrophosphate synthase